MFFTGLCVGAFICLAFLVDGLPSLLFSFFFNFLKRNAGGEAITVEQLLSMRDKLLSNSKTLNEPSRQIKYSFKAIHLNFILQSDGYTG